jgi:SAM-dependent methyltransferase
VDLEHIPFPDRSFDIVITTEVMEHVRHVDTAHREIARCLDEDGTYLFTVPYDASLARTWQLIDPVTDEPLVRPMHMHGDPGLREEGIKSYRVFGHRRRPPRRGPGRTLRLHGAARGRHLRGRPVPGHPPLTIPARATGSGPESETSDVRFAGNNHIRGVSPTDLDH